MISFVTNLKVDPPLSPSGVGGKAAALSLLVKAGFPTPPGICLTTNAFHLALAPHQTSIDELLQCSDLHDPKVAAVVSTQISTLLLEMHFPDEVSQQLFEALPQIATAETPVVVRSSATHEDSIKASFAGQYDTMLGVCGGAAIVEAVLDCWRSFFNVHALSYRASAGDFAKEDGLAILLQPLIEAECAGVCFSIDPVAQNRERIVVNAAWGLGVGVAEGTVPSDTDWLKRENFAVEKRHIVQKETQVKMDSTGQERIVCVPQEASRAACLPEKWLQRIAQYAVALENLFGSPQEVEWAISGGQVWILQSRPITALPPNLTEAPPFPVAWEEGDQFYAWEPSYYRSYLHDPPLTLEIDQLEVIESIREETCRFMGVERNLVTKQFNGRPYSRPVKLDWSDADRRIRHQALQDWQDRLFDEGRTLWDVWGPEVENATERLRAFDSASEDGEALAHHLEEVLAVQRRHAFIHPLCTWHPRKAYYAAYAAIAGESGPDAELAATQLLEGEDNPLTRLIEALYELAALARGHATLEQLLRNPGDDNLAQLSALPQDTAVSNFRQQLDEMLSVYGERHGHGYGSRSTIHTPTWREQPVQILRLVTVYLDPQLEPPVLIRARAQQRRDERLAELFISCADKQAVAEFGRLLTNGRRWWTVLETHNHYIDQMTGGLLRHATMAAAAWLVKRQVLLVQDDVFWMTFAEILQSLRSLTPPDLTARLQRRKTKHARWAGMIPPPILGVPNSALEERPSLTDDVSPQRETNEPLLIRGQAAAPGQWTGRARIVQGENNLPPIEPGDILVARNVGPRWTPIFPLLGGLVLDGGSVGQHAAATAREYGVVAVIAAVDATKRIPDKSLIFVDGTTGTVQIRDSQ